LALLLLIESQQLWAGLHGQHFNKVSSCAVHILTHAHNVLLTPGNKIH
jgi:hypothetical protein